jgi:hypothetical protein
MPFVYRGLPASRSSSSSAKSTIRAKDKETFCQKLAVDFGYGLGRCGPDAPGLSVRVKRCSELPSSLRLGTAP